MTAYQATAPSSEIKIENINQLLSEEFVYESSVTKFGRPIRDKYEDFIGYDVNPLKNYDRRNFQNASDVSDLIFPNTRQATEEDIKIIMPEELGIHSIIAVLC